MSTAPTSPPACCSPESWIAGLLALLLGVLVVGRPVWDADFLYLATDTASVQAPWHATQSPLNSQLSDSGVAFYPHYRKLSQRWRAGELPLWNPDIYVGVPLLANAQWGALDPQVLALVALEALGGETLFDRGFAWLAVLRIALAAFGMYLLARRLALSPSAAALAAVGYSLSGSLVLWLGFSLSHVSPFLPWVLLGIEKLRRDPRPLGGWLMVCTSLALAIYGGHPEVAFFVGLCAGLWSLTLLGGEVRRMRLALLALVTGVLLAAPVLLPFAEYLANSGALLAHQLALSPRRLPDLLSLGALIVFAGGALRWRVWMVEHSDRAQWLGAALLALGAVGLLWFLELRGMQLDLGLSRVLSLERASGRVAFPIMILALAAPLAPGKGPGRFLVGMALGTWSLAAAMPVAVELWSWIPLVGLAAPARCACCAALLLSLLAGHGLQHTLRWTRLTLGLVLIGFGLFAGVSFAQVESNAPSLALDTGDSVVTYARVPGLGSRLEQPGLSGALHGGLNPERLILRFELLGEDNQVARLSDFMLYANLHEPDVDGDQIFDFGNLDLPALGPGTWRLRLEFERDGKVLGRRFPALVINPEEGPLNPLALGCALLSILVLGLKSTASLRWSVVAIAALQGGQLARAWNPAVPLEQHLFRSATEEFLAKEFPGERFVAAPGILPGNTALLQGLSTIDGYDALDVDSFDGYRAFALKPGRNPLLHWNADGIDLTSPAFRLFGVRLLLQHVQRDLPGWTLIAGPVGADITTEVFIYRANEPLPRAYCVSELLTREEVLADPSAFDPRRQAFLENSLSYELRAPFTTSETTALELSEERLQYEVTLDGEGLFLCTEQHFPGWTLTVDGDETPILRVNSIFRGVLLSPGTHQLVFEYDPDSWRRGLWLAALGALILGLGCVLAARSST